MYISTSWLSLIYEYCKNKNVPVYEMILDRIEKETRDIKTDSNRILLYHGSKSGIKGKIKPISRDKCDFGKGFIWEQCLDSHLP